MTDYADLIADLPWYADHSNLLTLATWMEERSLIHTADEAIRVFEKPWNYEDEWAECTAALAAERAAG